MTDYENKIDSNAESISSDEKKKDANSCIALGTGVGVIGTAAALITGSVCPLCVFVAPGLIGLGSYMHWQAKAMDKKPKSR